MVKEDVGDERAVDDEVSPEERRGNTGDEEYLNMIEVWVKNEDLSDEGDWG